MMKPIQRDYFAAPQNKSELNIWSVLIVKGY